MIFLQTAFSSTSTRGKHRPQQAFSAGTVMQRTGNENADEQGEDGGMAAALGDDDYTSAVDKE